MSASGQYATAAVGSSTAAGFLYYSANYGATWTQTGSSNMWKQVIMSASGQYQIATTNFPSLLMNYRFNTADVGGAGLLNYATGQYDAQLVNGAAISTAAAAVKVGTAGLALTAASSQYAALSSFTMTSAMQTSGITVAGWVNLSAGNGTNSRVFDLSGALKNSSSQITGTAYTYNIQYLTGTPYLNFSAASNTSSTQTQLGTYSTSYTLGNWVHIGWVMNSGSWQIYINGSLVTTYTTGVAGTYVPPTTYNSGIYPYVFLGRSSWASDPYATGYWNDFRMYSTALSAAQVAAIYNSNTLGTLQYSSNFGQSWQSTTGMQANYSGLAMSSTGQNLAGCINNTVAGGVYGSVTANGPMATSGNLMVGGVLTAPVHTYADGSAQVSAGAQLDYTTFANNWTTTIGNNFIGTAVSASGQYQVAGGNGIGIYASNNYGLSWTQATGVTNSYTCYASAISASGQYQTIGPAGNINVIYISSNYGVSFTNATVIGSVNNCAMSASGQYQLCSTSTNLMYSSNYGNTWISLVASSTLAGCCISSSGQYMMYCTNTSGLIYYSSNYGQAWIQSNAPAGTWSQICCSASGQYAMAGSNNSVGLYYSSNYGQTWAQGSNNAYNLTGIACSASGQYVCVSFYNIGIYYSNNFGQSYGASNYGGGSLQFFRVSMSADACYLLCGTNSNVLLQSITRSSSLFTSGSLILGNSANTQNQPQLVYNQVGAGSTSNYGSIGFLSNANTLCWTAAGNVGIGTTVSTSILQLNQQHVGSGIFPGPTLTFSTASGWYLGAIQSYLAANDAGTFGGITGGFPGGLAFQTKSADNSITSLPTTKMVINAGGYVGIGSNNPQATLDVNGSARVNGTTYLNSAYTSGIGGQLVITNSSTSGSTQAQCWIGCDSSGNGYLQGYLQGTGSKYLILNAAGGNVGIGTTRPTNLLNLQGSGAQTCAIAFNDSNNPVPYVGIGYDQTNDGLAFYTNQGTTTLNATSMFLKRSTQFVGIGSTNPQATLDVNGSARVSSLTFNAGSQTLTAGTSGTGATPYLYSNSDLLIGWSINPSGNSYNDVSYNNSIGISLRGSSNSSSIMIGTIYIPHVVVKYGTSLNYIMAMSYASAVGQPQTSLGSISHTTTSVAYNTTSDQRLKENIQDITNARSLIDKLRPRSFNFINDENKEVNIGFIAQEVQVNYPQYIAGKETNKDFLQMDYGKMSPFAIAACKDLYTMVDTLQNQVAQLEARLATANIA